VEVDLAWRAGRVLSATLRTTQALRLRVRPPQGQRLIGVRSGSDVIACSDEHGVACWEAGALGTAYVLAFSS
ncbi:MAG: hypothetical protein H0W72_00835, partial [Planctomycetes bacterium]|nr:hypothetical protein [Planctomycetota bacterium]